MFFAAANVRVQYAYVEQPLYRSRVLGHRIVCNLRLGEPPAVQGNAQVVEAEPFPPCGLRTHVRCPAK